MPATIKRLVHTPTAVTLAAGASVTLFTATKRTIIRYTYGSIAQNATVGWTVKFGGIYFKGSLTYSQENFVFGPLAWILESGESITLENSGTPSLSYTIQIVGFELD